MEEQTIESGDTAELGTVLAEHAWPYDAPELRACERCGIESQIPAQPPVALEAGVVWECPACGGRNRIGGESRATVQEGQLVECPTCARTFTADSAEQPQDGLCPGCGAQLPHTLLEAEYGHVSDQGSPT